MSVGPSPSLRTPALRGSRALLIWIGLGTAVRVVLAVALRGSVAPAEADGFVRAWTGWSLQDSNRLRPAGWLWLDDLLGRLTGAGHELALRLAFVALSLLALACAFLLVVRLLEAPQRGALRLRACTWLAALWALWPALADASVRPVPGSAGGAVLCLLAASLVGWWTRPTPRRWVELALALLAGVLVGGLPIIVAVLGGLIVFVLPLPRAGLVAPLLLAVLLAGAAVQGLERSRGAGWRPEGSAAASALQLLHVRHDEATTKAVQPEVRAEATLDNALRSLRSAAGSLPAALARRMTHDLLGPARWRLAPAPGAALALVDGFLLGVTAVAACLVLRRRSGGPGWPRAALASALVLFALLTLLAASDPWALAPLQLLLAATAAIALAEGGGRRPMLAAGIVLAGIAALSGASADSGWDWMSSRDPGEGAVTVELLRDGGPRDLAGHLELTALLTDPAAPFLRLPEAAQREADAAVALAPDDPRVLLTAVRAMAERLDFEGARSLAGSILGPDGAVAPEARSALLSLSDLERRMRAERLP